MRDAIHDLLSLGRFPPSASVDPDRIRRQQDLLSRISPPLEDDEAKALISLFGPDDYFGLAWTLLHLIETASVAVTDSLPPASDNEWIERLKRSATRKAQLGAG